MEWEEAARGGQRSGKGDKEREWIRISWKVEKDSGWKEIRALKRKISYKKK